MKWSNNFQKEIYKITWNCHIPIYISLRDHYNTINTKFQQILNIKPDVKLVLVSPCLFREIILNLITYNDFFQPSDPYPGAKNMGVWISLNTTSPHLIIRVIMDLEDNAIYFADHDEKVQGKILITNL